MSEFDGIDESTSALAVPNGPLTREVLEAAVRAIQEAAPGASCGSEERPHLVPTALPGASVRCISCGEQLVALANGRAMRMPKLGDFFKREPLRFLDRDPGKSVFQVPPEYRYSSLDAAASRQPLHIYFDEVSSFTERDWRRWKRAMRKPNRTRSTKRTDFSARGVPDPILGELVPHVCPKGHRYAGARCPLCRRVRVLTARQWRAYEAARNSTREERRGP